MTGGRREQVEQIVIAVWELKSSERAARLDSLCGGDVELRSEVEALLAYESLVDRFLEAPALEVAAQSLAREQSATLAGMTVGPYRIDSLLGSLRARGTRGLGTESSQHLRSPRRGGPERASLHRHGIPGRPDASRLPEAAGRTDLRRITCFSRRYRRAAGFLPEETPFWMVFHHGRAESKRPSQTPP